MLDGVVSCSFLKGAFASRISSHGILTLTLAAVAFAWAPGAAAQAPTARFAYPGHVTKPHTLCENPLKRSRVTPECTNVTPPNATATNQNFGAVDLGATSSAAVLTVTFNAAETLGSIAALTLGAPNLDFNLGAGTTCAAGNAYAIGATCKIAVTFSPKYSGTRYGAVVLADGSGNVLGNGYLQGYGQGPQTIFPPGSQSVVSSGFSTPWGVAVDGAGNVYVAAFGANAAYKETLAGGVYTQSTIPASLGLNGPRQLAVDGAGKVYIADSYNDRVVVETPSAGTYVESIVAGGLDQPGGVAVDGSGDVYIADTFNSRVVEEILSGGAYTQTVIATGFSNPYGVAVDGEGNVYVADEYNSRVVKETLSAGAYTPTSFSGFYYPQGVAVDGNGNIYISDTDNGRVVMEALSAGIYTQSIVAGGVTTPYGVAVDGSGNVYIASGGEVLKQDLTDAPSLTFATTAYGSTSSDSPKTVNLFNLGNEPLIFPAVGFPADFPESATGASDCAAGTLLLAAEACALTIDFSPIAAVGTGASLSLNESVTADTNSLNLAQRTIAVSGVETKATPTVNLVASADPSILGASLTLTTRVLGADATPTGSVTFTAGLTTLGAVSLIGGTASFTTSSLALGTYAISAAYAGNSVYSAATSNSIQEIVTRPIPSVTLTSSANPSTAGGAIAFTATAAGTGSDGTPAGTVTFYSGPLPLGTGTLTSGVATFTTSSLAPGSYTLTASYGGSGVYASAVSSALTQVVAPLAPALTLASSANPSPAGSPVKFTAIVQGVPGWGKPTGSVTFNFGNQLLGKTALNNGLATLTTSSMPMGTYTVTAAYSGNGVYGAAVSTDLTETITVANFGAVSLAASNTALIPVSLSGTGTLSGISVVTQGEAGLDFTNAGGGSCTVGIAYPSGAICTVSVMFAPRSAGARYGGIVLTDTDHDLIANAYLQGTGLGAQTIFAPPTQTTIGSSWLNPQGVAADGNGNVYVSDVNTGGVYKETPANGGFTQIAIASGLSTPQALAVDGSGNVYVADSGNCNVYEESLLNGAYTQTTLFSGLCGVRNVAVDGSGNVYIVNPSNRYVYKQTPSSGGFTQTLVMTASNPVGLGVDGSGNVYIADAGTDEVYEAAFSNEAYGQSTIASHLNLGGLGVDGVGNIYVTVASSPNSNPPVPGAVYKETPLYGSFTESAIGSGWNDPAGIAADGGGNVYVADSAKPAVYEVDFANPPTLSFASTAQGSTSTDSPQTLTVSNLGNAALKFSAIAYPADFPHSKTGTSDCTSTTSLPQGESCPLTIDFAPVTSVGAYGSIALSESVTVTTNTLNVPLTAQAVTVNGIDTGEAWTVKLTSSATTAVVGSAIVFPATVTPVNGAAPSGTVTFYSGVIPIITANLNGDEAAASVASLPVGSHSITAVYSDTVSNAIAVTITKAAAAVSLKSSAATIVKGEKIEFTVNVADKKGVAAPTGTITIYSANSPVGTAALHDGVATLSTGALAVGQHSITADYSGDKNYLRTASKAVIVIITPPPAARPAFSIGGGTYKSAQTVAIGDSTPHSTIYYTANGTIPTKASTRYTGPIKVSSSETIKAVAVAADYAESPLASVTYTIQ